MDGHKIALALRAAYLSTHRKADAALLASGITSNQFVVLSALDQEDGVSQRALVERIASDPNTIRPILSALEEKGLVVREPSLTDGRVWEVKLTRKGKNAFAKANAKTAHFRDSLTAPLTKTEAAELVELLEKITESVNRPPIKKPKRAKPRRETATGSNGSM